MFWTVQYTHATTGQRVSSGRLYSHRDVEIERRTAEMAGHRDIQILRHWGC